MARAYGVTLFSTAVGTTVGLFMSALLGYGLSFKELPGRRVLNFIVILTLLFNGGLVPTYIIYTHLFSIKNTIWAQIVPSLLMNGFNVIILRSYFANNIPPEVIESSRIDGAKEFTIFRKMILPLSLPILATVGLIIGVMYWNSWMNGLYYITNPKYYNLQNVLNRILLDIRFLTTGFYSDIASDVLAKLPTVSIRMAIAVVGVLPIMVIYPFFQKYFVKGITIGAVKG
jgi:putative aldouronate transport system permease protein